MKNAFLALAFLSIAFSASGQSPKAVYNVLSFGAKGDGTTSDTKAINRAIDSAAAKGGGQVYFPAGNYLSGSIHLKSDISLYLEKGATIIATDHDPNIEYDAPEQTPNSTYQDYGHSHFQNSLIWGEDLHDVSVLGPGMIWGKGLLHDHKGYNPLANKSLVLFRCRNVIIKDVVFKHAGWFAILATGVDNLTIDNVKMDTNRDGMDIDCCHDVHISNCVVNSPWDDGICLKSSFALGFARTTENVTITNCKVSGYDEGSLLAGTYARIDNSAYRTGRIKLGTESNGGFKNVAISNCTFDFCSGLALETVDGALLEDVKISNITMRNIIAAPIFMRLGARMRGPQGTPVGELRRVSIDKVQVYNANARYACIISGIPGHYIRDIDLSNIHINYDGGGTAEQAANSVPELEKNYPEPSMFGITPSYGFYIRHVDGIKLHDIEVSYLNADERPAFIFDDVQGIDMHNVKGKGTQFKYINPKQ